MQGRYYQRVVITIVGVINVVIVTITIVPDAMKCTCCLFSTGQLKLALWSS